MPWEELQFGGLQNSVAECRVPRGRAWSMQNCTVDNGILELGKRYALFGQRTSAASGDVGWGLGYGKYSGNEVQLVTGTGAASGGSFVLRWRPDSGAYQQTPAIAYNATASAFQAALEDLGYIEPGDIYVTGGPLPGELRVQFQRQYANTDLPLLELLTNSLVGTNPSINIREETKGGTSEEYLAVVQHAGASSATLYSVDPQTGTYTYVASGLSASDWYFTQYAQRLWAVNLVDGLNYKILGGSWNSGSTGARPIPPSGPPSLTETRSTQAENLSGCTITVLGMSASSFISGNRYVYITNTGSAITGAQDITIKIRFAQDQDWSHRDVLYALFTADNYITPTIIFNKPSVRFSYVTSGGQQLDPLYRWTEPTGASMIAFPWATYANTQRTERAAGREIWCEFTVNAWPAGRSLSFNVFSGYVWLADTVPFTFGTDTTAPAQRQEQLEYAYSYLNTTTNAESNLSPAQTSTTKLPTDAFGCWVNVLCKGSSQLTTSDRVLIYRRERSSKGWRRLPLNAQNLSTWGVANATGSVLFIDKWMEEELKDFPLYGGTSFPGTQTGVYPDQIGVWKQCLVVGASKQAWISYVGQPTLFAPSPDDTLAPTADEDDLTRGKTEYVSDDRSEDVYGVHGQDSLYLVTPLSIYSIIGDIPAESTPPRRLPESRGTLGRRSSTRLGGGVLAGAEDGLWRYSVGRGFSGEDNGALIAREETEECRRSYAQTLLGGQLAASGMVVVEYLDERWIFNGDRYMVQTRNRHWLEGTLTHSVKAAQSVRHLPLRFLDTQGRMHSIGVQYTTDAGSAISWSYTTGILDGYRSRIRHIQMRGSGRPQLTIWSYDGRTPVQTQTLQADYEDQNYLRPLRLQPGLRYRFKFEGQATDTVEFCALEIDANTSSAVGN